MNEKIELYQENFVYLMEIFSSIIFVIAVIILIAIIGFETILILVISIIFLSVFLYQVWFLSPYKISREKINIIIKCKLKTYKFSKKDIIRIKKIDKRGRFGYKIKNKKYFFPIFLSDKSFEINDIKKFIDF